MNPNTTNIKLSDLEGRWYINQSNFPMWLKGDKKSPTFNYTLASKKGKDFLLDSVQFIKNGKQKSINGKDRPTNTTNTSFVWRGNGLMCILKSKWKIVHLDMVEQWAIIFFESTLFTPRGYDVISRQPQLNSTVLKAVNSLLKTLDIRKDLESIEQSFQ